MAKAVRFTEHARKKLDDLAELGFSITEEQVIDTVSYPEYIDRGASLPIAQRRISEHHVLRVVFVEREDEIVVVTFYPGRRSRYESEDAL